MIFLTGHHATGKTEAGGVFAEGRYLMVDTGPLMRELHQKSGRGITIREWIMQGEADHGSDFTNRILAEALRARLAHAAISGLEVVIVGFRSLAGIQYLLENVVEPLARTVIVFFETPSETMLRERWMAREGRHISPAEFRKLLARERAVGIDELRERADHRLVNAECLDTFRRDVVSLREILTVSRRWIGVA